MLLARKYICGTSDSNKQIFLSINLTWFLWNLKH